ncbi:hypothetical protein GALMADRAFT_254269 [Galerina marginata CBS 339.88]|uniref:Pentacotripeptide-repeat region of PRORP domain-containing protein n=1 Tax=Galerina marginata (strain CBS 339.88) TaxID=685588 RepID=A0A067SJL5_GALM3|nr:hypothetical protein GALMADRAFT_254269 [Galerina marginata CBS 339.88]
MLQRLKVPNNLLRTPFKCFRRVPPTFRQLRTRRTEIRIDDTLRKLLPSIKTILSVVADDDKNSDRWVHSVLDTALKETAEPHRVYEEVVSYLLLNQRLNHALTVFRRMQKAGFTPSPNLVAQTLAPMLAMPDDTVETAARQIVHLFMDPGYTDEHLNTLLRIFAKYDVGNEITARIVDFYRAFQVSDYVPSPPVLSSIVTSAARMGKVEEAFDMLARGSQKTRNATESSQIFYTFLHILETFRSERTWDSESFARVINLMIDRGWLVNIRMFDVLISREVRAGSPRVALTMYEMLKVLGKTHTIRPTAHTFGSLFALYRRLDPKTYQNFYTGQSPTLLPLRRLFHEFHGFVTQEINPIVPSTSVLNAALRAFLRQRDYAGAFAVIDSFLRYKVPLDHRTYHSVMKLIVRRVWYEVSGRRKKGEIRWADRFLGAEHEDVELCVPLVDHLLVVVSRSKFNIREPIYPLDGEFLDLEENMGRFKVPTLLMMEHKYRPDPWDFHYEPVPLKRILHRAILAEDPSMSEGKVVPAILLAKAEMLKSQR